MACDKSVQELFNAQAAGPSAEDRKERMRTNATWRQRDSTEFSMEHVKYLESEGWDLSQAVTPYMRVRLMRKWIESQAFKPYSFKMSRRNIYNFCEYRYGFFRIKFKQNRSEYALTLRGYIMLLAYLASKQREGARARVLGWDAVDEVFHSSSESASEAEDDAASEPEPEASTETEPSQETDQMGVGDVLFPRFHALATEALGFATLMAQHVKLIEDRFSKLQADLESTKLDLAAARAELGGKKGLVMVTLGLDPNASIGAGPVAKVDAVDCVAPEWEHRDGSWGLVVDCSRGMEPEDDG